jgi:hypothetical protein
MLAKEERMKTKEAHSSEKKKDEGDFEKNERKSEKEGVRYMETEVIKGMFGSLLFD